MRYTSIEIEGYQINRKIESNSVYFILYFPKIVKKSAILIGPRRLLIMLETLTLLLSSMILQELRKLKLQFP